MRIFFLFFILIFCGCDSKKDSQNNAVQDDISSQGWAFDKRYVKAINENSWEQLKISPLNDFSDFKIDLTLISTGKPQNCTLYSKGIFLNRNIHAQKEVKNKKTILFRPNVIPNVTITITQENKNKNVLKMIISDLDSFLQTCGNAHTHANGEYNLGSD